MIRFRKSSVLLAGAWLALCSYGLPDVGLSGCAWMPNMRGQMQGECVQRCTDRCQGDLACMERCRDENCTYP